MSTLKNSSLICNCVDGLFNFFFDSENKKIYLSEDMSPDFVFLMDSFLAEEYTVVYLKSVDECPVCGSDLSKNGTDGFLLNKSREIRKQKYVCSDKECKKHTKACLDKFIDKHCILYKGFEGI